MFGAWRILDAQYAGVAQRRRRVFVVGHFGDDWRPPAAVLFEQPGLCGDTPPSREAREETAPYSGGGIDQGRVVGTVTSKWAKGSGGPAGDEAYNLVCFPAEMSGTQNPSVGDLASTLKVKTTLAFAQNTRDEVRLQSGDGQITGALTANSGSKQTTYVAGLTVRRLTPRECERLQGFPDDFTLIHYRHGKPAADGPRYKALGNSMAVLVIGWVLNRVRKFTELQP